MQIVNFNVGKSLPSLCCYLIFNLFKDLSKNVADDIIALKCIEKIKDDISYGSSVVWSWPLLSAFASNTYPASILRKSISGRYRPVSYPDGPMTARYRFT